MAKVSRSYRWFAKMALKVLLAALLSLAGYWRVQSFRFARKVERVLTGLAQVKIDQTTEAQLLALAPGLTNRGRVDPRYGFPDEGVVLYGAAFSNDAEWNWWFFQFPFGGFGAVDDYRDFSKTKLGYSQRIAYWLGWRYEAFGVAVWVRNGMASTISTSLADDIQYGWPRGTILEVRSMHALGYWEGLTDMDEDNPGIFIRGELNNIAYTPDAPAEFTKQLYPWDLRCYYLGFGGCRVRDLAPQLWQSMQEMKQRAARRKSEDNPCSDRTLADRVRRFGVDVELLEVVKSPDAAGAAKTAYTLREVLQGQSWEEKQANYREKTPRPAPPAELKPGDRVIKFYGAGLESCTIAPATPSAIQVIRDAVPAAIAPRLQEDFRRLAPSRM